MTHQRRAEVFVTAVLRHGERRAIERSGPEPTDAYWVYGGSLDTIIASVRGRKATCHLDERLTARNPDAGFYVHDLGTQQP
jgi:cytochrome c oxidase cbb3-type subunit 3